MRPPRLQHVSIPRPAGSQAEARAFYGELLGLPEKPLPATLQHLDLVWFALGGDLELHTFSEEPQTDRSGRHFCIDVEDLASVRASLEAAGYTTSDAEEIRNRPRFFTTDPFGNSVEITSIQGNYWD
jgi:catechol 2,3-dioxygenase-like lactoylglutathione lyase family enzyme